MPRNKSEKHPHREQMIAFAHICEKAVDGFDTASYAAYWDLPGLARVELSDEVSPHTYPHLAEYIFKTYGRA